METRDCTDVAARISPSSLTTAPGSGLECDGCHQPIEPNQVECRCFDSDRTGAALLRFHQWCYYARAAGDR